MQVIFGEARLLAEWADVHAGHRFVGDLGVLIEHFALVEHPVADLVDVHGRAPRMRCRVHRQPVSR